MRRLSLVLVLLAVPAFADEKAKPNTLTPKEIADGWILLFDGETTFGWKAEGDVTIKDGVMSLNGGESDPVVTSAFSGACHGEYSYSEDGSEWRNAAFRIDLVKPGMGLLKVEFDGIAPTVSLTLGDASPVFRCKRRQTLHLRSIRVRPAAMVDLFNGKDLSGWKLYDAARARAIDPKKKDVPVKSQYTVTKEGWLNVKNGPGDLQTEGQWADFVVQLECISNGKHLNSGLFFRAIPDLYQEGYEAQIRNEWMGDDRTKPVDFGTGAIYRRQPARKVVSTDGEWFTMTLAAHGRHLATWVNGYQVTDWTDDRKEADNGRNGFKKGKGALSIQGHDPTTDLSFRNVRIQSLDPK
jgi:hypothetical protein